MLDQSKVLAATHDHDGDEGGHGYGGDEVAGDEDHGQQEHAGGQGGQPWRGRGVGDVDKQEGGHVEGVAAEEVPDGEVL